MDCSLVPACFSTMNLLGDVLNLSFEKILKQAMTKMGLSARAYDQILKAARTIADLAGEQKIDTPHVAEAIQYRNLNRPV